MTIEKQLLTKWTGLRSMEDAARIAEKAGVTVQTIRNAFRTGKCSDEVFKTMAEFYQDKVNMINQYLQPATV